MSFLLFAPLALVCLVLTAGCAEKETADPPAPAARPLRVARYYWPGMFWAEIAADRGWFAEEGLKVELVDTNADFYAGLQALAGGTIDVGGLYLFDVLHFNARGASLVGFLSSDVDAGATGIVVERHIGQVANLRGRTVAVAKGTFPEYLLGLALERHGLSLGDVNRVDLPAETAVVSLGRPEIDAVVTWEPMLSLAEAAGVRVFDTRDVIGAAPGVIAARREVLASRHAEIAALCRVWRRSTDFIRRDPAAAYAIVARIYRKTPEEVAEFARLDPIRDLQDNATAFAFAPGFASLHGAAESVNRYFMEQNLVSQPLDTTPMLDDRFVRDLQRQGPPS